MTQGSPSYRVRFHWRWLAPQYWPAWLAVGLLSLLAFLPPGWRQGLATSLLLVCRPLCKKPMRVARANLAACYPELSQEAREAMLNRLLHCFLLTALGMGELAVRSRRYLTRRIQIRGLAHLERAQGSDKPIIFLVPHMFALEHAGVGLSLMGLPMVGFVKHHRNPVFNWFACRQRLRFGGELYHRDMGIATVIRALKQGNSLFYLPDQDHGPRQSEFAPFFGAQKATLPVISRIARCSGAVILPLSSGYVADQVEIRIDPPLDVESLGRYDEARALNQQMERLISRHPDQYMWFLKLLKTRPPGESPLY